jgi:hypothetical protein
VRQPAWAAVDHLGGPRAGQCELAAIARARPIGSLNVVEDGLEHGKVYFDVAGIISRIALSVW